MASIIRFFGFSPKTDSEDSGDYTDDSLETIEEIFEQPLSKSQSSKEIIEASQKLKLFYNVFKEYTGCQEMKFTEFQKLQEEFDVNTKDYYIYINELKDIILIDENYPVIENCLHITEVPLIKMKIDKLNFMIRQIEISLSEAYIAHTKKNLR